MTRYADAFYTSRQGCSRQEDDRRQHGGRGHGKLKAHWSDLPVVVASGQNYGDRASNCSSSLALPGARSFSAWRSTQVYPSSPKSDMMRDTGNNGAAEARQAS